jgi:hypothetical protein
VPHADLVEQLAAARALRGEVDPAGHRRLGAVSAGSLRVHSR